MTSPIDLDFDGDTGGAVNPLEPQAPSSGVYGATFQSLFGTLSAEDQQEVWVYFLQSKNLTDPPATDAATQALFQSYASDVYKFLEQKIVSSDNFTVAIPLLQPPTTGFYGTAFQSYFADQTPVQQQKIWAQFLLNNHFTTTAPPEDAQTMQLFMDFALTVLSAIQNQNIHSPEEIRKRYIMALTLESLQKMLASLQDTIGVESRNLIFYGTYQQEYTKMMARVPTYVGQPDQSVHAPPTLTTDNLDSFTFGYDRLSVADVADWWASSSANGGTQSFIMSSVGKDLTGNPLITITYTPQIGTTPGSITWNSLTGGSGSVNIPLQPAVSTFTATPAQSQAALAQTQYSTSFKTAFISAWSSGLQSSLANINGQNLFALNSIDPNVGRALTSIQPLSVADNTSTNSGMRIGWGYSYVVPSAAHSDLNGDPTVAGKLSDDNAKVRAEINAHLQAVIDNIRARRKVIQNLGSTLQSNLDQTRQTVTDQSDLLNSILKSITDLNKAIFRK
ncbi:MAG: hypothetical protein LLF94_06690 [Chlamydiales bacterium]|nr:hypothetical protein [Chlamydiales bacterium]